MVAQIRSSPSLQTLVLQLPTLQSTKDFFTLLVTTTLYRTTLYRTIPSFPNTLLHSLFHFVHKVLMFSDLGSQLGDSVEVGSLAGHFSFEIGLCSSAVVEGFMNCP